VSYEPALGGLSIVGYNTFPDWLISGGESDRSAPRSHDVNWFREIKSQCEITGTAYWHKQHGGSKKIDGEWGGRELDGVIHQELPYIRFTL
jgi:protein gp37